MTAETNRAIIARLYQELFGEWRTSLIDELFDAQFQDHLLNSQAGGAVTGPEVVHQLYSALRDAFPDLVFKVEDMVAEGDKVVVRWTWTCTHLGEFRGIKATGRTAEVAGMAIYRLANGRIVERWVSTNLDQLARKLAAE